MSLILEILKSFENTSLSYKGVRTNIFGIPQFKNATDNNLRSTLSYMKKCELVSNNKHKWQITHVGKQYVKKKTSSLINFDHKFRKNAPKDLIVMYDIPESKKTEREWFRWHLKKFNYEMIQKSVWVGPSPLPRKFLEYLEKIKLRSAIKTLKLAKPYNFYIKNKKKSIVL